MKKWLYAGLILAAAAASVVYVYINKPHRSVSDEAGIDISADSLFQAFATNEATANSRYLNAVVRVSGTVRTVEKNTEGQVVIVLNTSDSMFGINCTLQGESNVSVGQALTIKGICTGYLADVVITQAIIEEHP